MTKRSDDAAASRLDRLARAMRGSLAGLRAAAETLERYPDMEPPQQAKLHGVVAEESDKLEGMIDALERQAAESSGNDRQRLVVADFLERVASELSKAGLDVTLDESPPPEGHLLAGPETFQGCRQFAAELRREFAVLRCTLRSEEVDGHLLLDWSWLPATADAQALQDWQGAALERGGDQASLRAVARDHGGEVWFDLDRSAGEQGRRAHVRVLLPLADG